jgi:cytochrome c
MNIKNNIVLLLLSLASYSLLYVGQEEPALTIEKQDLATVKENQKYDSVSLDGNVDFEVKRKAAIDLVERGIAYMQQNPVDQAFNLFSNSRDFIIGELYLFVYDERGVCLAHGQQNDLVWQNLWEHRDVYGLSIVQNLINKAKQGGGWVTYGWRNSTKVSYVKQVTIDGKIYVVGTGYFPHSKEDSVVSLVRGAVALFNEAMAHKRAPENVFALMSYPQGSFVLGDLYLYALDFEGNVFAQGDRPGLIGTSAWEVADAAGVKVNQMVIAKLKETHQGIWFEYISKKAHKRAYAEMVTDNKGKNYFIACGYYPDADRKKAIDLVRLAFKFMKANGLTSTLDTINDKRVDQFQYGDLYIEVYSLKGICLAHGNNQDLIGKDFWNVTDQDGKFYVRDMIKKASEQPGWVDFKLRNLFKSAYVERVTLGTDSYVIACGLYPISKRESTILLVKTAADYLNANSREDAFRMFINKKGKFVRGDLMISVFDFNGLCFAYGDDYDLIWKNLINVKDDDGKAFIRLLVNTAKNGSGQVSYRLNNVRKIAYLEPVEKDGKSYVVCSSYYM